MKNTPWPDHEIIEKLNSHDTIERALFHVFHEQDWRGAAIALVQKHRCTDPHEALETATDALMAFQKNVRQGQFEGRNGSSLKTYFLKIVLNKWFKKWRAKPKNAPVSPENWGIEVEYDGFDSIFQDEMEDEMRPVFDAALAGIGERCRQFFELAALKTPHEKIAQMVNLRNANMVKKAISRCRMGFRARLEKHPGWRALLRKIRDEK